MNYEKLDPEFKARWITALRSGEYKQTTIRLTRKLPSGENGYCCLGVACEIEGIPFNALQKWDVIIETFIDPRFKIMEKHTTIIGGANRNPVVERITLMNDLEGKTFPEIADWIEENL